ncbi:hypothetical protein AN958_08206 [Leucoagaricus sp. SymC.cos]|nr:hypothetical protein AN958_08206 [Leucoagaricus sp. SymC.cos]
MPLLVLYNPVCGSRSSKSFTEEHIIPLLEQHNIAVDSVLATEYPGHAGALVADYLKRSFADLTIILASGDGTLHEIINNYTPPRRSPPNDHQVLITPQIFLVLVPTGTANALYSSLFPPTKNEDISSVEYKLQSLRAYLDGKPSVPLTLSVTTFLPPSDSQVQERTVVSAVVTSTSAHASILHDSEELRKEFPGIERFKVAAQRNSKRWYNATVKLFPSSLSGAVQIYKPISRQFINHPEWATEKPVVELKGPFIYFLSTVNVDRLEPEFRITPLARTLPSKGATYDIVIVRPLRDPSNARADDEARAQYDQEGRVVSEGDGPLVVEYIRCGGWEWLPGDDDERAPLVCADGDILTIERGGKAVSFASTPSADTGFAVYG